MAEAERLSEEEIVALREAKFPRIHSHLADVPAEMEIVSADLPAGANDSWDLQAGALEAAAHLGMDHVPGYYIVRLDEKAFPYALRNERGGVVERVDAEGWTLTARALELGDRYEGEILRTWNLAIAGFAVKLPEASARALASDPLVSTVTLDGITRANLTQWSPPSWGLNRITDENISTENVYRYFNRGNGVRLYVGDTGLLETHNEFPRQGTHYDATGQGITDLDGHGTFVAGIAAGVNHYGVAKEATVIAVKVLGIFGGSWIWYIDGIDEILAMHEPGHRAVANFSLGGLPNAPADAATETLVDAGVTVVVAAGNDGADASGFSPARVAAAITVGASADNDSFVTFALTQADGGDWASNHGALVDVIAPGYNITSAGNWSDTDEDFWIHAGTSSSAPHVAGTAAKLLEWDPTLSPAEIEQLIVDSATVGKLTNVPAGTANRLLFDNKWFYPFHSMAEWQNSDTSSASTTWFYRSELGGWWMAHPSNYPWFWSDPDQEWLQYLTGDPFLTFQYPNNNLMVLPYWWSN
jgi:subtilisin family serine protease